MKPRWLVLSGILIVVLAVTGIPELRSDTALKIQSFYLRKLDIFAASGLSFDIPTGKRGQVGGWGEDMKSYQPGEEFPHDGEQGRLSILYNFGDFEMGRSTFYDPNSNYYNAHYGIYGVELEDGVFGYKNGEPDLEAIKKIVAHDQLNLVMSSLGCPRSKRYFDCEITDVKQNESMAGFDDWVEINAEIRTNSPLHQKTENRLGYLQYGSPPKAYQGSDFPVVEMYGKLFLRYDSDKKLSIIYFVIGHTKKFVEETSRDYLIPVQWVNKEVK